MPSGVVEEPSESAMRSPKARNDPSGGSAGLRKQRVMRASGSRASDSSEQEGFEVVRGNAHGSKGVAQSPVHHSDQNVFRHPQAAHPHPMHGSLGVSPIPHGAYAHASGSWGYGPPRRPQPHGDYPPPYPVPSYNPNTSFDDGYHRTAHYTPHVKYPPPGRRYPTDDVNVISPHHRVAELGSYRAKHGAHGPPPRGPHYYQYPPTSPVSRPGNGSAGPPRVHQYAMRRGEGSWHPHPHPPPHSMGGKMARHRPPIVNESSFDSEHNSREPTPLAKRQAALPPMSQSSLDPCDRFYGGGASWNSFDSVVVPSNFDDRHYGYSPPPDLPYGTAYSSGGLYRADSFLVARNFSMPHAEYSFSIDEEERLLKDYHPDRDRSGVNEVTPAKSSKSRSKSGTPVASNRSKHDMHLPKAAKEIDFVVTDPPMEPITPPGTESVCESLNDVNHFDVLCGRGGGTNSQVGNRRFRKLVQDFQPIYLLARRKEKPLLARTIVLIIRKRGGRFLRKDDETGELVEVGDVKAEAKTSQALREGLDVRATKNGASNIGKKNKSSSASLADSVEDDEALLSNADVIMSRDETETHSRISKNESSAAMESPPVLPRLQEDRVHAGVVYPHSTDQQESRKRRRTRPLTAPSDSFFPDFCPPRADIARPGEEDEDDLLEEASINYDQESSPTDGCGSIALDVVTGAATGSFCLGPTTWRP